MSDALVELFQKTIQQVTLWQSNLTAHAKLWKHRHTNTEGHSFYTGNRCLCFIWDKCYTWIWSGDEKHKTIQSVVHRPYQEWLSPTISLRYLADWLILPSIISPAPLGYVYNTFLGGISSEALNPEPVTELPLTPPAEEDEEDAAIALWNCKKHTHGGLSTIVKLKPNQPASASVSCLVVRATATTTRRLARKLTILVNPNGNNNH